MKIGAYIFTGLDNNLGKLEDILLPLMKVNNDGIFSSAESFLDANHDISRTFPLKLSKDAAGTIIETRSVKNKDTDFDRIKSVIGIAGQLQRSGKPNTAYISDTDYLTLTKINENEKCRAIIAFFNEFLQN